MIEKISLETRVEDRFKLKTPSQKWYSKLQSLIDEMPPELKGKIRAYTTGDNEVTIYDCEIYDDFVSRDTTGIEFRRDVCEIVELSKSKLGTLNFPFIVESTCG